MLAQALTKLWLEMKNRSYDSWISDLRTSNRKNLFMIRRCKFMHWKMFKPCMYISTSWVYVNYSLTLALVQSWSMREAWTTFVFRSLTSSAPTSGWDIDPQLPSIVETSSSSVPIFRPFDVSVPLLLSPVSQTNAET